MEKITIELVRTLIERQFPEWKDLGIIPVKKNGHDNSTFHLGDSLLVRLPNGAAYAPQIEKEHRWLPYLQSRLSLPVSCPVVLGRPESAYPYPWSVNRFVPGETANRDTVQNLNRFAFDLALFLKELKQIETAGAPVAGKHNFFRGAPLTVYNAETEKALETLKNNLPVQALNQLWQEAVRTGWKAKSVWIHGDIAPGNLLVSNGVLCGVIDFGMTGTGDPACDYAIAWTFFDHESRKIFLQATEIDPDTVRRAKGWALWKALITYHDNNKTASQNAKHTLEAVLDDI